LLCETGRPLYPAITTGESQKPKAIRDDQAGKLHYRLRGDGLTAVNKGEAGGTLALDVYIRVLPTMLEAASSKLERILFG
jgi:hypothetical protein